MGKTYNEDSGLGCVRYGPLDTFSTFSSRGWARPGCCKTVVSQTIESNDEQARSPFVVASVPFAALLEARVDRGEEGVIALTVSISEVNVGQLDRP